MRLTMRQAWILGYLSEHPGATLTQISEGSPVNEEKTADFQERFPGYAHIEVPSITYPTAQQAMRRLLDLGLVRREPEERQSNGPSYRHFFIAMPESDDPFERAFAGPSAPEPVR